MWELLKQRKMLQLLLLILLAVTIFFTTARRKAERISQATARKVDGHTNQKLASLRLTYSSFQAYGLRCGWCNMAHLPYWNPTPYLLSMAFHWLKGIQMFTLAQGRQKWVLERSPYYIFPS